MDAKALAKSKRAHSLHHARRPRRANPPSKAASPSLPSNRDRYESESEEVVVLDSILPKSKGADYGHLIEEARSIPVPSLNDGLFDFLPEGIFDPMVSVNGERITTWIENDNFVVDDAALTDQEASLFSLNLLALSEQLARVDISDSLFLQSNLSSFAEEYKAIDLRVFDDAIPNEVNYETADSADEEYSTLSQTITSNEGGSTRNNLSGVEATSDLCYSTIENKATHHKTSAAEVELDILLNSLNEDDMLQTTKSKISNRMSDIDSVGFPASATTTNNATPKICQSSLNKDVEAELDALLESVVDPKQKGTRVDMMSFPKSDMSKVGSSNVVSPGGKMNGMSNDLLDVNAKVKSASTRQALSLQPSQDSKMFEEFDSWMDSL